MRHEGEGQAAGRRGITNLRRENRLARLVKEAAGLAVRLSGVHYGVRRALLARRAVIINYHDPSPALFEKHMQFLAEGYNFIPLGRLADALHGGDWKGIPPRSVVVTFDDGHAGNYDLIGLFKRYGVVPAIYLCSGVAGTRREFWWTRVHDQELRFRLKSLPNGEMVSFLGKNFGYDRFREYDGYVSFSPDKLSELAEYVEFGSHTMYHPPVLPNCTYDECMEEIAGSKRDIERLTGRPCAHFSYPNGVFTEREKNIAVDAGYRTIRTVDAGWVGPSSDPFELDSISIPDDASVNVLAAKICTLHRVFARRKRLYRGSGNGNAETTCEKM